MNNGDSAYVARQNSVKYYILYLCALPMFNVNTISTVI
jgi:hypothetical protein